MATDEGDSSTKSPQFPLTLPRDSRSFRKVPTSLFLKQIEARRARREPLTIIEAWCSLDYDLYRHGKLESERAYAANWRRSRAWTAEVMRAFRAERELPDPRPGRPPSRGEPPAHSSPQSQIAGQFTDQAADQLSAAYSAPWERRHTERAGHSAGHSEAASKKQRL